MNNSKNGKINPDYYKSKIPGIECIDVVKYLDFPIGNAIKYLWRAGNKRYDNLDAKASAISKFLFHLFASQKFILLVVELYSSKPWTGVGTVIWSVVFCNKTRGKSTPLLGSAILRTALWSCTITGPFFGVIITWDLKNPRINTNAKVNILVFII